MKESMESPLCKIPVKGNSAQITIKKDLLNLSNENTLLLNSSEDGTEWVAKVTTHRYSNCVRLTSSLKGRPKEINVIKVSKEGHKPKPLPDIVGRLDILKFIDSNWTCIERDNERITIYKPPKGPNITIKRALEINDDIAWATGFYLAEGSKISSGIGITNHEYWLLKKFQKIIKRYFGIHYKDWRVYVHSKDNDIDELKSELQRTFRTNKILYVRSKLATKTIIEIRLNSTLFSRLFNTFIAYATDIIIENKVLALSFLKGYEIGDGCVLVRKGLLYGVSITTKSEKHADIIVKSLKKIYRKEPRVRVSKGKYQEITCSDIRTMTEFILNQHFSLSPKQWNKFVNAYLKKQYTRSHIRYWFVLRNRSMLTKEIAKATNRSFWAVLDALRKDAELGLIRIKKQNFPNKPYLHNVYSLTNKCNKLLNLIEDHYEETKKGNIDGSSWKG